MLVQCAEALRVQAYFDHEVDAVSAAEVERHVERCVECQALLRELHELRTALRGVLPRETASPELRERLAQALDGAEPVALAPRSRDILRPALRTRQFWAGALAGVGSSAIVATVTFVLLSASIGNTLLDDVVAAHLRSLGSEQLIEVASSDRHTVKPWFSGHADVSPVVEDFAASGYTLVGGRVDPIHHQRSAVLVYRHGAHVINVFTWAIEGRHALARDTTRRGYHIACWSAADLQYCAVSDTGWDELHGLVQRLQEVSAGDLRE
jgi:anti-sigma factor RsiW